MNGDQPNDRRASGALVILLVFLLLAGGGAFVGFRIVQDKWLELDVRQTQFDSLKRRRPASPSNESEKPITVKPFLAEGNFALAANALQKRVVGAIEDSEGKLVTVSVDPPVTGDAELERRVSVQVTAELTNEALQKVLYQLESETPFVFVESFSVSRPALNDAEAKTEAHTAPPLSVSLSVTGYRRKGTS